MELGVLLLVQGFGWREMQLPAMQAEDAEKTPKVGDDEGQQTELVLEILRGVVFVAGMDCLQP